jgi:integrase
MGLRMASPWKHPQTGTYYLRERVPLDLVDGVRGRRVTVPVNGQPRQVMLGEFVKVSLGTKEPKIAKDLYRDSAAAVAEMWQRFRQEAATGPVRLTGKQVEGLAGQYYRELLAAYEENPGSADGWDAATGGLESTTSKDRERVHGETADQLLQTAGLVIDMDSRKRLLGSMNRAAIEAGELLYRRAKGDYSPDPNASRFPDLPSSAPIRSASQAADVVTLSDLFGLWEADHRLEGGSPRTAKDFRQKVDSLIEYLGHENARNVTPRQVAEWAEHLRHQKGISATTVANKYLVAVKRIFTVGKKKFLISDNPAKDVSVEVKKATRTRSLGFTDAEARAILVAALRAPDAAGKMTEDKKRAIRWGPWLCAYTGARIGEIMQLRKQDVEDHDGILCLRITPEAGTTKTGNFRVVPLHPHLLEMGFLDMVKSRPDGPLFYAPKAGDDPVMAARNAGKKVSSWVRQSAGITDERLQPNHAWRHRFKTVAREVGIHPENADTIQGHEDGRASSDYGDFTIKLLAQEIGKLPRYEVE